MDATWGNLIKLGFAYGWFTGGDNAESRRGILKEAKDYLKRLREEEGVTAAPSGRDRKREREASRVIEVALSPRTRLRGEVLAELAAARLDVRTFRRRYLQDRLLSDEEVKGFLRTDRVSRKRNAAQRALRRLGEDLERAYGWRSRRARRFVLTGRAPVPVYVAVATGGGQPEPVPISAEGPLLQLAPPKARITVEADAWVGAEEVASAFKAVQRQLLSSSSPRKRPERTLELIRFVARQIREYGGRPSWEDLRVLWNRKHPEWRYKEPRLLRQTFERFMRSEYKRPKWKRGDTD